MTARKMCIVYDADAIDKAQWKRFVSDHPQGTVFQTPQMFEAYKATTNYKPLVTACFEGNSLMGILLAVVQKEYGGFIGKFSARSIIWGGPLIKEGNLDIFQSLLDAYDREAKKKAIYSQFRNMTDWTWATPIYNSCKYLQEDHLNIIINLKKSEDELWKSVHSKRRNEIRRAYKEKLEFSIHQDENTLESGYNILHEVYKYAKLPFPDISLFKNILAQSTDDFGLKIFAAEYNSTIIGAMFALVYKNRIYDWYAGSYRDSRDKYPNDLIPWEVMKWGKLNGYEIFDFGGAGRPGIPYGVRDYKLKYGGQLVNFGRWEKVHQPISMVIAKSGFKIWRLLKR